MKTPGYCLKEREIEILVAISTFRYLTCHQVTRLFFSSSSRNFVGSYLKRLTEKKYLLTFPLPSIKKGNRELIYALSPLGRRALASLGYTLPMSPTLAGEPTYLHFMHIISLNDFLIVLSLLPKKYPHITIAKLLPDWQLKHAPLTVNVPRQDTGVTERLTLTPDAWIDLRVKIHDRWRQMPLWLELDRGTEERQQFQRKIQGIVAALHSNAYQERFGTKLVTLAFATTNGEKRLQKMRTWIHQVLSKWQRLEDEELFFLTSLPQGELDSSALFCTPCWTVGGQLEPVPLLPIVVTEQ